MKKSNVLLKRCKMKNELTILTLIGLVAVGGLVFTLNGQSQSAAAYDDYVAPAIGLHGAVKDLNGRYACRLPMRALAADGTIIGEGSIPTEGPFTLTLRRGWNQAGPLATIQVGTHEVKGKDWKYCSEINLEALAHWSALRRTSPFLYDITCEIDYLRCERWRKQIVRTPYVD